MAINDVYSDITLNRGVRTISNCPIRCLPANHAHCCWCERCQKHFGDVALLENKPRNADVFAQTDGRPRGQRDQKVGGGGNGGGEGAAGLLRKEGCDLKQLKPDADQVAKNLINDLGEDVKKEMDENQFIAMMVR